MFAVGLPYHGYRISALDLLKIYGSKNGTNWPQNTHECSEPIFAGLKAK